MTHSDWKKVRAILERAAELVGDARAAYLAEACGDDRALRREVEALLAAETHAKHIEPPSANELLRAIGTGRSSAQRIGAWQLEREIARGGMGSVWLAHRVDGGFAQRAAIKLIKRGMDSDEIVRRFERERAMLAALEHPCIARLYDGGSTEHGQPYLVMEFVEGQPLDEACRRTTMSLANKLELFASVCDAVQHAHQNLVVHRDLKPSNVLVTPEGQPKLLDFGIAKVLTPDDESPATRTATEQRFLTPAYASPEQMRGERITTRSDVFSLGVILYELLAGRRPFEPTRTPDTEAIPPSRTAAARELAGDLDTIVMKALQLEPERRYASAAALADDVRRHLAGDPVQARPDTWRYRASKFVRRNRVLVSATAVVMIALASGLVIARSQYLEAERARQVADRRLRGVVELAAAFSSKLNARLGQLEGISAEREALMRDMIKQLEELASQAPDDLAVKIELGWSRRELAAVLGSPNQVSTGRFDEARVQLEAALRDIEPMARAAPRHVELANLLAALLNARGDLLVRDGALDDARRDLERALEVARVAHAGLPPERELGMLMRECDALHALISLERDAQRRDVEAQRSREFIELAEGAHERHPEDTKFSYWLASALNDRGVAHTESGENQEALVDLERAHEMIAELARLDPLNAIYRRALPSVSYRIGGVYASLADTERAYEFANRAWEEWEQVVRAEPQDIAAREKILAFAYAAGSNARQSTHLDVARRALERALESLEERIARRPEQRQLLMTRATLGTELAAVLSEVGEWDDALALADRSIQSGLQLVTDEERGNEWHYGMSLSYANQAEVRMFVARDAPRSPADRRIQVEAARADVARARELLQTGEERGQLGADERGHFEYIDALERKAEEIAATIPES
ncbi:MAG: serine/threonine protein kinase [Planctomycetes bacterium]|nr:serine/threonine protein kinase [Planctomycetota bacterium]